MKGRLMPVRAVYELWATATTYKDLHRQVLLSEDLWAPFRTESFCFDVTAANHKIPDARQKKIIDDFAYMGYTGEIRIKGASNVLTYLEECQYYV
jgi:tRNA (guanine10-N2)-methyltransferase